MKVISAVFLTVGFLTAFMAGASGMIIAGVGPGGVERALGMLASAVAGFGLILGGALIRSPKSN